jgi:cation diffusion facilitator family transporter
MQEGSRRAVFAALAANLGIAVAKFVGFLITGAASMQAEAVHSLADTGNQALLLVGGASARRKASADHPFGYGRERYFWSFVVALMLFSLGSLFAIYDGVQKLRHLHEIESPGWAVGILLVALALEAFSFRTAIQAADEPRRGRGWWSFIHGTKTPELPVVILEDLAALCGLLIALAGVGLAVATQDARFDAAGSVGIGVVLGAVAIVLAVEMKSLLIGESATPANVAIVREAFLAEGAVRRVIHMRTLHIGPDELLVAAKLEFDASLTLREVSHAIDGVEKRVRERLPIAKIIYIEPDFYDPAAARTAADWNR